MAFEVSEHVHVVPFGIERDRIVEPVVEHGADRVVLLDYLSSPAPARPDRSEITSAFDRHGVAHECRQESVGDVFDALAAVGQAIVDHEGDDVYVNLAGGSTPVAVGAMLACMTAGARPYYVAAEEHGSHRGPVPRGVRSVDGVPSYPVDRPETQQLRVMAHVADSDRRTAEGEPYRIKRELFEFGEREGLPFIAEYDGKTTKGKFRRLDAHIVSPLEERGFLTVREVGTQRRVFLTEDGRNTLRAFRYCLERTAE